MTSALVVAALAAACQPARSPVREPAGGGGRPPGPAEGEEVAATVDGVPITASRVARLAEETGRSPEEVVERLVEFELLAAEARRRRYDRDRTARGAVRKSMVQRYLAEEFEATHRMEDIPESVLELAYRQNRYVFVYPRAVKVAHIVVIAEKSKTSAAERAAARRWAAKIARDARSVESLEAFLELGRRWQDRVPLEVRVEDLNIPVSVYASLDEAFIEGSLALEEPGDVSPPVEGIFGTHVIYLKEVREASNETFEEVREEVAQKTYPSWQQLEFEALTERLRLSTKVVGWSGERRRDQDR